MAEGTDWTTRNARSIRWEFLKRSLRLHPWPIGLSLLLMLGACAGVAALLIKFQLRDLGMVLLGAGVVSIAWWFLGLIDRESGAASRLAGAEAEISTREELSKLRGHHLANNLWFDGRDVDHVLVGPSGLWAIETKWIGGDPRDDKGTLREWFRTYVGRARWAAGRIDLLVRVAGKVQAQVRPVLVLWGPGAPRDWPASQELDGVTILIGREAVSWRSRFTSPRLSDDQVRDAWRVVEAQGIAQRR